MRRRPDGYATVDVPLSDEEGPAGAGRAPRAADRGEVYCRGPRSGMRNGTDVYVIKPVCVVRANRVCELG